jgi:hypothetical protein
MRAPWIWALATLLATGCASMAVEKPILSFDTIAGQWVGTVYYSGGADQVQLTVNKDGSFTATSPRGTSSGHYSLVNGKMTGKNDTTGAVSDVTLGEQGSEQVLVSTGKTPAGGTYATEFRRKR